MAWEHIKHRALSSVNHAAQKADRAAQIAHLRKQIQKLQQEQTTLFTRLGSTVYASFSDASNWPPEWQTLCDQLHTFTDQITALSARIDELVTNSPRATPATLCGHCQQPVEASAKFCAHCGATLRVTASES